MRFFFSDPEAEERERKRRAAEEAARKAAEESKKRSELIRKYAPGGALALVGALFLGGNSQKQAVTKTDPAKLPQGAVVVESGKSKAEIAKDNTKAAIAKRKGEEAAKALEKNKLSREESQRLRKKKIEEEDRKKAEERAKKKKEKEEKEKKEEEFKRKAREEKAKRDKEDTREFPLVPALVLGGGAYLYTRPKAPADEAMAEEAPAPAAKEEKAADKKEEAPAAAAKEEKAADKKEEEKGKEAAPAGEKKPEKADAGKKEA